MTTCMVDSGVAHLQEQGVWKLGENQRTGACEHTRIYKRFAHVHKSDSQSHGILQKSTSRNCLERSTHLIVRHGQRCLQASHARIPNVGSILHTICHWAHGVRDGVYTHTKLESKRKLAQNGRIQMSSFLQTVPSSAALSTWDNTSFPGVSSQGSFTSCGGEEQCNASALSMLKECRLHLIV